MSATSDRIFCLLQERGIEQKEFARQIGISDKTVSAWKTGRAKSFTKYLPQIAKTLNVSIEDLVEEGETTMNDSEKMELEKGMDNMEAILTELSAIRALLQNLPELHAAVFLQMNEEYRTAQMEGKKASDLWIIAPPSSR